MFKKISLSDITLDLTLHARAEVDEGLVERYAKAMEKGDSFPDIRVITNGVSIWPVEGWHRTLARLKLQEKHPDNPDYETIQAIVQEGTVADVLLEAAKYNRGKNMTPADKRALVQKVLEQPELAKFADREVARRCGVSHHTVKKVRESVGQVPNTPRVGSDGKSYKSKKSVGNLPNSVGQNIPEIPSVGNLPNTPEDILPPPPDDDIFDDDDEFASEASGDPLKDIQGEFGIAPVNAPEEPVPTGPALASEPDEAPKEKPDPLPAPWLEILREVQETGVPENNITLALQSLLKKVRDKYS